MKLSLITTPLSTILDQIELYTGPKENRLLRNVAAKMFCENPSKFFPYTQIDVVTFPNEKMKDPNNSQKLHSKAVFHNCPRPDRSISKEDIEKADMLKSRRYRNRRLGDFLKELDLTEGRSTGVPTIQAKLAENGSPRAIFETTDDRLTCLVTIPVHEGCRESSETNSNSSETDILGSERGSETKTKSSERSSETKDLIIDIIKQDPHITAAEIAMQLNMSSRGVEKQIRKLRELGKIKRTGGRFGGYWEIVILDKE